MSIYLLQSCVGRLSGEYHYDAEHFEPPAPAIRVVIRNPGDPSKFVTVDALLDTGADINCLPLTLIRIIGGKPAGTKEVFASGRYLGSANSYFLEFEISTTRMLKETLAFGDEIILGRNLLNDLVLELDGPAKKVRVIVKSPQQK